MLEVAPGLPAARAGLAPGDRLLAVDGRGVGDLGDWGLAQALQGQPHSAVRLTFERRGQPVTEVNLIGRWRRNGMRVDTSYKRRTHFLHL